MKTIFRDFKTTDKKELVEMILGLFHESPGESEEMNPSKISKTIKELTTKKEKGSIIIFESQNQVIGYSILINIWSNEHAKDIILIDELYIKKEFRSKGIATKFIENLKKKNRNKIIELHVTPENKKALKLYKKLGFKKYANIPYIFEP